MLVSQPLSNRVNPVPEQRHGLRRSQIVLDIYGRGPNFVTGRPPSMVAKEVQSAYA